MTAPDIVTVYAIFPDAEAADRIGRTLVEERLAACVNRLAPCRSTYRWQGAIETADEVPALFKTRAALARQLVARLAELHPYDVPAAVVWPIETTLPEYAAWITEETKGSPRG